MGSGDERRRLLARDEFFEPTLRFFDFLLNSDGRTRLIALGNSDDDVVAEEEPLGSDLRFLDVPTEEAGMYEVGAKVGARVAVALCCVGKGRRARRVVTVTADVDDAPDLAFFDGEKKSRSEDEQGTEESMASNRKPTLHCILPLWLCTAA